MPQSAALPGGTPRPLPAPARRPYLVFIRAGAQSTHGRLIAEDPCRNWDCCIQWHATPTGESLAEYSLPESGRSHNKLQAFLQFWRRRPNPCTYRYILLLDDDVYLQPGDISRFFDLCERHGTYLAQPAQRWSARTTLNALVINPTCVLRRVSFLGSTAPCFSSAALEHLIHNAAWAKSIWGARWGWSCLLEGPGPLYVVDAVSMERTRVDDESSLRMLPLFRTSKTLPGGHVFRTRSSPRVASLLMLGIELLKVIVRAPNESLRLWRLCRASIKQIPFAGELRNRKAGQPSHRL